MGQFFYFVGTESGLVAPADIEALGLASLFPEGLEQKQFADSIFGKGVLLWGNIYSQTEQSQSVRAGTLSVHDLDAVCPIESPVLNLKLVVLADSNNLPTEADLRRDSFLEQSDLVKMGDGELWAVPRLRDIDGNVTLPSVESLFTEVGKKVVRKFAKLDQFGRILAKQQDCSMQAREKYEPGTKEHAAHVAELMAPDKPLTNRVFLESTIEALAANYRVGPGEVELLELLTTESRGQCMAAMLGRLHQLRLLDAMLWEKKRSQAQSLIEQVQDVGAGVSEELPADAGGSETLASAVQ